MNNTDRRDIAALLVKFFPHMTNATSDDWHFFLDNVCTIDTPIDMANGQAFDRWRERLAEIGYPTQKYTAEHVASLKAKADGMQKAEQARAASESARLESLRKEAPDWPVAAMLAKLKGSK
jgi:hypothetical protein